MDEIHFSLSLDLPPGLFWAWLSLFAQGIDAVYVAQVENIQKHRYLQTKSSKYGICTCQSERTASRAEVFSGKDCSFIMSELTHIKGK